MRYFAFLIVLIGSGSHAQPYKDPTALAVELGSILGSESACDLDFDNEAIKAYLKDNANPDDLSLPNALSMMTDGTRIQLEAKTPAQLAAHCQLVRQSAGKIGILSE